MWKLWKVDFLIFVILILIFSSPHQDEYVDNIKTLPRDWNIKNYIEPPAGENEKEKELQENVEFAIDDDRRNREASGLVRTGRLFGGLINDIKRKTPHYLSDFRDGLHPQIISSFLFLYFACLAPIIAFGALLGEATKNRIATIEGLVAGRASKDGSPRFHNTITEKKPAPSPGKSAFTFKTLHCRY